MMRETSANDVEATMLLCDYAQAVNGKLYIVGGGWSLIAKVLPRFNMSLAVKLAVPWSRSNERIHMDATLITDQGAEVTQESPDGETRPVKAEGDLELGRPPGLRAGTPLDATFVLNFEGLDLDPGGYVWQLQVGGDVAARIPFQVINPTGMPT
jgi:hypothetical protein